MTCVNGRKLYDEQLSHVNGFWLKKKQNFFEHRCTTNEDGIFPRGSFESFESLLLLD